MKVRILIGLLIAGVVLVSGFALLNLTKEKVGEVPGPEGEEAGGENVFIITDNQVNNLIVLPEGFSAYYFIPPTGLTLPCDVVVDSKGEIFVTGDWISRVSQAGEITPFAETEGVYSLAIDSGDNIYTYNFPSGEVFKITPNAEVTTLAHDNQLLSYYESDIAISPSDELYVMKNWETGNILYKLDRWGNIFVVNGDMPYIQAIDFAPWGKLYAAQGNDIFEVDLESGDLSFYAHIPISDRLVSHHGLVIDNSGNFFVTTDNEIYKISPNKEGTRLVHGLTFSLEGIAVGQSGELYTVSRESAAVLKVTGTTVKYLVQPNYLCTPQAIAFNSKGELHIVEGEAGYVSKWREKPGRVERISTIELVVYNMPWPDFAMLESDEFYFSEAAPGFPSRVVKVTQEGTIETVTDALNEPAGLALDENGRLFVADYGSGEICIVSDSTVTTFVSGFEHPEFIAFGPSGGLFVAEGGTIHKVTPSGVISIFADDLPGITYMAFDDLGYLFVSHDQKVSKISPEGDISDFATGFSEPVGLAFDDSGNLFVADFGNNSITKIIRTI